MVKTHAPFWHTHRMLNCVAAIGAAVFVRSSGCAFLLMYSHYIGGKIEKYNSVFDENKERDNDYEA